MFAAADALIDLLKTEKELKFNESGLHYSQSSPDFVSSALETLKAMNGKKSNFYWWSITF